MIKSTDSLSAEKFGVAKSLGRVECVRIQNILEIFLYTTLSAEKSEVVKTQSCGTCL